MASLNAEEKAEREEQRKEQTKSKLAVLMDMNKLPPIDTNDTKQLQQRIDKYFMSCIEHGCIPGLEGLCNAIGISRATWNNWRSGGRRFGQEHQSIVMKAEQILKAYMEQSILDGEIQSIPAIFMMSNQYDYVQKQVVQQDTNVSFLDTATPEQLESRYSSNNVIDMIEEPTNTFKQKEEKESE